MARIFPFQPYRYSPQAGPLEKLLTQPYDKITPEMQARYLELSPYNLVRVELGPASASDSPSDNVYTRAAACLREWIAAGVLVREPRPAVFPYFQEFRVPESGERAVRQGFIGLGAVQEYEEGVVHRHERTLAAPKQDRLQLLRSTRAHTGQIFMLYPDPARQVDRLLEQAAAAPPLAEMRDEDDVVHRLWRIADPDTILRIRELMSDKKLLIADGHHRYETALAFRRENPGLAGADKVMMTFVNLHSPGLKILATHRLVSGLEGFDAARLLERAQAGFLVRRIGSLEALREAFARPAGGTARIGLHAAGLTGMYLLERERGDRLALEVLHQEVLGGLLGIGEEALRQGRYVRYVRGLEAAAAAVERGEAQAAFLVEPVGVEEVARVAFSGGVMPQKSTDFYPKLLSGMAIYRLGE